MTGTYRSRQYVPAGMNDGLVPPPLHTCRTYHRRGGCLSTEVTARQGIQASNLSRSGSIHNPGYLSQFCSRIRGVGGHLWRRSWSGPSMASHQINAMHVLHNVEPHHLSTPTIIITSYTRVLELYPNCACESPHPHGILHAKEKTAKFSSTEL